MDCPHPLARAARASPAGAGDLEQLHVMPSGLQGAAVAVVCRDTRGVALDAAQRLSHFPASPLVCLSWFQGMEAGLVTPDGDDRSTWTPFGAQVVLSGSQSAPRVSWAPTTGRGGMVCFAPDAAQALFGLDLPGLHDRFVDARSLLGTEWQGLLDALLAADGNEATLRALERHLLPRWRVVQGPASVRDLGRQWVQRLACRAHAWRRTHSSRQVERRVKAFSGRSLRDWQQLVRTEAVFFAARDRVGADDDLDWAVLAQDGGFADQAHLIRASRRITGFTPGEFARRFLEDESFWLYRLWV